VLGVCIEAVPSTCLHHERKTIQAQNCVWKSSLKEPPVKCGWVCMWCCGRGVGCVCGLVSRSSQLLTMFFVWKCAGCEQNPSGRATRVVFPSASRVFLGLFPHHFLLTATVVWLISGDWLITVVWIYN
jgi:hypothetical protein